MQNKHVVLHDALDYLCPNTASDHPSASAQRYQAGTIRKCHSSLGFGGPIKQAFGIRCGSCGQHQPEFNIGVARHADSQHDAFSLIRR